MAGKKSKPAKKKIVKEKKPLTFEEKLSDTKSRMEKIVKGNDSGYHLR
tara:strand:+ start:199 stop:342 length:144 start_codon:yes stop_codon:yes gene_type:complete